VWHCRTTTAIEFEWLRHHLVNIYRIGIFTKSYIGVMMDPDSVPPDFGYDYQAWTDAISKIDVLESRSLSHQEITKSLATYANFLTIYPWLYAYWIQYANLVLAATDDFNRAIELLRTKALAPSTLKFSVEMWSEYLKFHSLHNPLNSKEVMRAVYVDVLDSAGSLFGSGAIWKEALGIEVSMNGRPFFLLAKAVSYPINEIRSLWTELQPVISKTSTAELVGFSPVLSLSELFRMKIERVDVVDEQEVRAQAIERLTEIYNAALKNQCRRLKFETLITRSYFHFYSPDESQIMNWDNYLTMLEKSGATTEECIEVFERALIPCALIDSMWIRYANYAETVSIDLARQVYKRAPYRVMPRVRILFAEFEEEYSSPEVCREIYHEMSESNVAELVRAAAHFEIRSGNNAGAVELLTAARDRLQGDLDGWGLIAAELLELAGVESECRPSAVYIAKLANRVLLTEPQRANTILYEAILGENRVLLEDRIPLLKLYLELLRRFGTEAGFQLEMELLFLRLSNLIVWHRDYFSQSFIASAQPPVARARAWIEYQKQIPPEVTI
jgi:pre-mRNA-processing factor 39